MDYSIYPKTPSSFNKTYDPKLKAKAINFLLYGDRRMLNKVCKEGRYIHKTHFFVLEEPNGYVLQWLSRKKLYNSSRIQLDKTIQIHEQNHKLRKNYLRKLDEKRRHLTIKYSSKNKTLVLEFENEEEREFFRFGLEYFVRKSQILHDLCEIEKSFLRNFEETIISINEPNSSTKLRSPVKSSNNLNSNSGSKQKDKSSFLAIYYIPDFKHLKELITTMGLNIDIEYLNILYDEFKRKEAVTDILFDKFKEFLKILLARKEVLDIYLSLCEEEEREIDLYAPLMSNIQLQEFFRLNQNQLIKIEDINEIIKKSLWSFNTMSSSVLMNSMNERLSFLIFCRILFSENNSIFSHEKSLVYQDMDHPLSDYYINGLTKCFMQEANHPYFKLQDFESYIVKAIDRGTRYLELHLTNHEENPQEAVIAIPDHDGNSSLLGYQPIFFREVLKILKRQVFFNNPFPFFLSLKLTKSSCLSEEALYTVISEILGLENIFPIPPDHKSQGFLPSPKALERKFLLIFAGNLPDIKYSSEYLIPLLNTTEVSENEGSEIGSEEGILDENPAKQISMLPVYANKTSKANFHILNNNNMIMRFDEGSEEDEEEEKRNSMFKHGYEQNLSAYFEHLKIIIKDNNGGLANNDVIDRNNHVNNKSNVFNNHCKDSGELSQKILPKQSHIKQEPKKYKQKIKAIKSNALLALGSFFEAKIPIDKNDEDVFKINTMRSKDLRKHPEKEFVRFHRKHISLVYNVMLNDENALSLYQTGAQINYLQRQSAWDVSILANFSKFQENGGVSSGYLLKPPGLLHNAKEEEEVKEEGSIKPKLFLNITILSGSQLKSSTNKKTISPYVEIGLIGGVSIDEQSNKIYRTNVVENNGFNPIFNETISCEFEIFNPELTVIYLQVWDEEETQLETKFIGWYGVPVTCIRPGLRIVPLRDQSLAVIDRSALLCKVETKIAI